MRKICLFLALILLCGSLPLGAQEAGPILTGKVNTTVTRGVPLPFNAIIDEVLVAPGEAVEIGSPLVRYHLQDEAGRILQRELTIGADTENLKSQVLILERELTNTQAERNKTRQLVSSGLGSRQALARLDSNVASLQNRIKLLNITIDKAEKNFAARLKELSGYFGTEIKSGEPVPEELVLTSPIKGYLLSVDAAANPGQLMAHGAQPVQVGQLDTVIIRVPVYETDLHGIKVGDSVDVEIPSLNNRKFTGTVGEIAWSSNDMNVGNPSYYMVEITVPNPDLVMKPGFKAVARFHSQN